MYLALHTLGLAALQLVSGQDTGNSVAHWYHQPTPPSIDISRPGFQYHHRHHAWDGSNDPSFDGLPVGIPISPFSNSGGTFDHPGGRREPVSYPCSCSPGNTNNRNNQDYNRNIKDESHDDEDGGECACPLQMLRGILSTSDDTEGQEDSDESYVPTVIQYVPFQSFRTPTVIANVPQVPTGPLYAFYPPREPVFSPEVPDTQAAEDSVPRQRIAKLLSGCSGGICWPRSRSRVKDGPEVEPEAVTVTITQGYGLEPPLVQSTPIFPLPLAAGLPPYATSPIIVVPSQYPGSQPCLEPYNPWLPGYGQRGEAPELCYTPVTYEYSGRTDTVYAPGPTYTQWLTTSVYLEVPTPEVTVVVPQVTVSETVLHTYYTSDFSVVTETDIVATTVHNTVTSTLPTFLVASTKDAVTEVYDSSLLLTTTILEQTVTTTHVATTHYTTLGSSTVSLVYSVPVLTVVTYSPTQSVSEPAWTLVTHTDTVSASDVIVLTETDVVPTTVFNHITRTAPEVIVIATTDEYTVTTGSEVRFSTVFVDRTVTRTEIALTSSSGPLTEIANPGAYTSVLIAPTTASTYLESIPLVSGSETMASTYDWTEHRSTVFITVSVPLQTSEVFIPDKPSLTESFLTTPGASSVFSTSSVFWNSQQMVSLMSDDTSASSMSGGTQPYKNSSPYSSFGAQTMTASSLQASPEPFSGSTLSTERSPFIFSEPTTSIGVALSTQNESENQGSSKEVPSTGFTSDEVLTSTNWPSYIMSSPTKVITSSIETTFTTTTSSGRPWSSYPMAVTSQGNLPQALGSGSTSRRKSPSKTSYMSSGSLGSESSLWNLESQTSTQSNIFSPSTPFPSTLTLSVSGSSSRSMVPWSPPYTVVGSSSSNSASMSLPHHRSPTTVSSSDYSLQSQKGSGSFESTTSLVPSGDVDRSTTPVPSLVSATTLGSSPPSRYGGDNGASIPGPTELAGTSEHQEPSTLIFTVTDTFHELWTTVISTLISTRPHWTPSSMYTPVVQTISGITNSVTSTRRAVYCPPPPCCVSPDPDLENTRGDFRLGFQVGYNHGFENGLCEGAPSCVACKGGTWVPVTSTASSSAELTAPFSLDVTVTSAF